MNNMNILFLDQSGKLGGAELSLAEVVKPYQTNCLVGLFSDGPFKALLEQQQTPVQILTTRTIDIRKESGLLQSLSRVSTLIPLITQVVKIAHHYELIYANTQKALVIGALASILARRPLVYHLRDILSVDHFSSVNRRIAVTLANRFASLVITNSEATRTAFIDAGGDPKITHVVYNGFIHAQYQIENEIANRIRQQFGLENKFVIGQFSRLSPWKGQHVLIQALAHCPKDVIALLVGDALFGEQDYVDQLHQQVSDLGLQERVVFLGFQSNIPQLMAACNLIAHTSTAPEPFGRVIVEGMLCGRPVVATAAGGAIELIEHGKTGWLYPPGNPQKLADLINFCRSNPDQATTVANQAQSKASQRFNVELMHQKIAQLLAKNREDLEKATAIK